MTIKRFCDVCGEISEKSYCIIATECDENGDVNDEQLFNITGELCAVCAAAIAKDPLAAARSEFKNRAEVQ